MSYTIPFSDEINNGTITVEDGVTNSETSVLLSGRGAVGYGEAYAQNFLHLLENFANNTAPSNPVQGQIWYDSSSASRELKVFDGVNWQPANGIKKSASTPTNSKTGDLWVNTRTQQLYLYTGSAWILIGPDFENGTASGAKVETIVSSSDEEISVISMYISNVRVAVLSDQTFTPKRAVAGFPVIRKGVNLTAAAGTQYWGLAEKADNLVVNDEVVAAANFLRSDTPSTTNYAFSVKSNNGVLIGSTSQYTLRVENDNAVIQQNVNGGSINLRTKNNNVLSTVLSVTAQRRVGVNTINPETDLDISGSVKIAPLSTDSSTGILTIETTTNSDSINNGALVVSGGVGIAKDLYIGGDIYAGGGIVTTDVIPLETNTYNIGSGDAEYSSAYIRNIFSENITAEVIEGDITGNATTASKLQASTNFAMSGDVDSVGFSFDGSTGGTSKTFSTVLSSTIISSKDEITEVGELDEILVSVPNGSGPVLKRASKFAFLKDLPMLVVGSIMPYAGDTAPSGWLLCDGSEVLKSSHQNLWEVIGHKFKAVEDMTNPSATHFGLPDLRGRGLVGLDNMGGTSANRVTANADVVGANGGAEEVDIYKSNLPNHSHDLRGSAGTQFYAVNQNTDSPVDDNATTIPLNPGITGVQALGESGDILDGGQTGNNDYREVLDGGVVTDELGAPLNVMNPFVAVNYIIYAG